MIITQISNKINEMVTRINRNGCRIVIPFSAPLPTKIMFATEFNNAEWITTYPATLYIYGDGGQVTVCDIDRIEQRTQDEYIVSYGRNHYEMDMMIRISEC